MCELTVAIAVYNLEDYIEESLLSVLDQDFDDMEVFVCDDCSTDRSLEIVEKVIQSHKRGEIIRVLSTGHNSGTAISRNLAIDQAQGKYIMFLDGDDLLAPHSIFAFYNNMIDTDVDMVIGNIMYLKDNESVDEKLARGVKQKYKPGVIRGDFAIAEWLKLNKTEFFIAGLVNKFFKTKFIRDNNIRCKPDHSVVEDQYFFFLLQLHVRSISTLDTVAYVYRQRGSSVVHTEVSEARMKLYLSVFNDIKEGFKKLNRDNPEISYPHQLYYLLTSRYLYGFVTIHVLQSRQLSLSCKNNYLKQISTIQELGLRNEDLLSRGNKIFYRLLQSPLRLLFVKTAYWIIKFKEKSNI